MSKSLFSEFDTVSAKAFKQKIQYDLKGADYNKTLVWNTEEGIDVKPFYSSEDFIENTPIPDHPEDWKIGEEIFILDPKVSARTANEVLAKGTQTIIFKADKPFDVSILFSAIENKSVTLYFRFSFLDKEFLKNLALEAKNRSISVFFGIDIIGNLAVSGNWFNNMEHDFSDLQSILGINNRILTIDASPYLEAGATIVQQLAYSLAQANEYLNAYQHELKDQLITFNLAVSSNYFFEIAKIRALRLLYAQLAAEYGLPTKCHITVSPAKRNKVIYDYNTNMLRTTTECMSAILGGADTVTNLPYDALYHKTNEFGQRISRNQLLILREESYFDSKKDAAAGSYYVETLTRQFAEKALDLFKKIEADGGFLKLLKAGTIQRKIKESAQKEQADFDADNTVLLGINKHPNLDDRMKNDLELYPFLKINPRKTLVIPIIPKRLAEEKEKQRLQNE
ncbi:methylmalonyl-CoA mutase subunit beta [Leeuwenhoekiella sp. A16]|uniref:methylmalonyl-CoA mutase subunit beta n=1 Tax=unclassified Leeuwenhoekiella TaxID=2615029 RepID=UPI003A8048C8